MSSPNKFSKYDQFANKNIYSSSDQGVVVNFKYKFRRITNPLTQIIQSPIIHFLLMKCMKNFFKI
jgi:hypothetical protein